MYETMLAIQITANAAWLNAPHFDGAGSVGAGDGCSVALNSLFPNSACATTRHDAVRRTLASPVLHLTPIRGPSSDGLSGRGRAGSRRPVLPREIAGLEQAQADISARGRIPATLAQPGAAGFWIAVILTGLGAGASAVALTLLLEAVQHLMWPGSGTLLDAASAASAWRHVLVLLGAG